jgi:hypothetical protein
MGGLPSMNPFGNLGGCHVTKTCDGLSGTGMMVRSWGKSPGTENKAIDHKK